MSLMLSNLLDLIIINIRIFEYLSGMIILSNSSFVSCENDTIIHMLSFAYYRNAWLKRLSEATEAALSMERVKRERAMSCELSA